MSQPIIRLRLYVTDLTADQPLPQQYLTLPDVQVLYNRYAHTCERCNRSWPNHAWVVTPGDELEAIDCSIKPREIAA